MLLSLLLIACSSNETTTVSQAPEAGTPTDSDSGAAPPKDAGVDTSAPGDEDAGVGETCVGYGEGDTCAAEPGKYGYVCFNGAPPGVASCKLKQSSSLGNSYCCTENVCVEQIDQGSACNGVTGKPHRFQCPPTASGNATPAVGCEEHNSGSTDVEKYYCCP